jgi:UPF0755 protein
MRNPIGSYSEVFMENPSRNPGKKSKTSPLPFAPQRRGWVTDLLLTLVGLTLVLGAAVYLHFFAPPGWARHTKVVVVPNGTSFLEICRILEENGIIRDRRSFYLYARLQNAIPKVKAGEYEAHTRMTPAQVLHKLMQGDVIQYPVTIPEGYNLYQVGEVLAQAKVCRKEAFLEKARDPRLVASLGLEGESMEGYLFPDTYNFPKGYGEEAIIRQMAGRFKAVYAPLARRAEKMGLNQRDVVILASMIEKEAMDDQERRLISAVFHNRLQRGMALQSDPTAVYGVKAGGQRITREDLQRRTPYNTYQLIGLPKGPIANPGLQSLEAVLSPAEGNYLYFVSKNDGTHYFSSTLAEHNQAVSKYQRRGKSSNNP